MKKNKTVVLVICSPEGQLAEQYSTIVLKPYVGEIPLGVLYLASELEKYDFDVSVIDNTIEKLSNDALIDKILMLNPMLIGFSITVFNVQKSIEISSSLKRVIPATPIVYGGPNVTILPERHAALECVDVVIKGQGELSLRELAQSIIEGEYKKPSSVKQKIIHGKKTESLDYLAYPARHLVDLNKYARNALGMKTSPCDFMCSSRGCPFNCTFCSSKIVWKKKYYKRTPASVVDEIEFLMTNYGSKGIYFREDNFTVDKQHVTGICNEILKRKLDIAWECESRVDTLSEETLALMKKAGCNGIWCGVESGSQKILNFIRKDYTVEQVKEFYAWCKGFDIKTSACFMLGFPIETDVDMIKSFELSISLPTVYSHFAVFVGFPGSELFEYIKKESLWEKQWYDTLIPRSQYYSFNELCLIETTINKVLNKPEQHYLFYNLLQELKSGKKRIS